MRPRHALDTSHVGVEVHPEPFAEVRDTILGP